jgi:hypothetical protein
MGLLGRFAAAHRVKDVAQHFFGNYTMQNLLEATSFIRDAALQLKSQVGRSVPEWVVLCHVCFQSSGAVDLRTHGMGFLCRAASYAVLGMWSRRLCVELAEMPAEWP